MIEKSQILSALSGLDKQLYEINADGNYVSITIRIEYRENLFAQINDKIRINCRRRAGMTLIPHSDKNLINIGVITGELPGEVKNGQHTAQDFGQSSLEDLPIAVVSLTPKHFFQTLAAERRRSNSLLKENRND